MKGNDLTILEIGGIIATGYISKIAVNLFCAWIVQRYRIQRLVLSVLACFAAVVSSVFVFSSNGQLVSLAFLVWLNVGSPIVPLGESLVISSVRRSGASYGKSRLWGSASVAATAIFMGTAMELGNRTIAVSIIPLAYIGLFILFLSIKDDEIPANKLGVKRFSTTQLRSFATFVLIAAPLQALHGLYYAYNVIHFQELGFTNPAIAVLWVAAIASELLIYIFAWARLENMQVATMISLAAGSGVCRWTILGSSNLWAALVFAQFLQGLTLAVLALAVAQFFVHEASAENTPVMIAWYNAFAFGVFQAGLVFIGALIFEAYSGGSVFLVAATVSLVCLILNCLFLRRSYTPHAPGIDHPKSRFDSWFNSSDLRPNSPPYIWRIRRFVFGRMQPVFQVAFSWRIHWA